MEELIDILEAEVEGILGDSGIRVVILEEETAFLAKMILASEFMISYSVRKDETVVEKMTDAAHKAVRFKEMYMDGALNPDIWQAFLDLPGVFNFIAGEVDIRAKRLIGTLMENIYGRHNIYAMNVTEENIRVDTRGGRFYFKYTDFNVSVKKEMELIDKVMRKPLRKRYKI